MPTSFADRLRAIQQQHDSYLCVGLDPDLDRLPEPLRGLSPAEAVLRFNRAVIAATAGAACAFKLNFAFYEALGRDGHAVLAETLAAIPDGPLTIADAKRGDIGNSARFYAASVFDELGFDAVTVAPYMGRDAVAPFLEREGTAAFVLARTSNLGGHDFQPLVHEGTPLFLRVARKVAEWDAELPGTAGLVAGATDIDALAALRDACPALPFLIPGVGAQGGDPAAVMRASATDAGLVLVNSSRQILYASGGDDYAEAAGRAARATADRLRDAAA